MTELLEAVSSWKSLLLILVIFGLAPGVALRAIVLLYRSDDPRRRELLAELYGVPRWERPLWVAQQLETAFFEGLVKRLPRGKKLLRQILLGINALGAVGLPILGGSMAVSGIQQIISGESRYPGSGLLASLPPTFVGVVLVLLGIGVALRGTQGGLLFSTSSRALWGRKMCDRLADILNAVAVASITVMLAVQKMVGWSIAAGCFTLVAFWLLTVDIKRDRRGSKNVNFIGVAK